MINERVAAHPFQAGKWYRLGELRRVAAEMIGARQADPALSAMMRVQSAKWAKDWNEELYPLKVFADHKALSDDDEFCWTPDATALTFSFARVPVLSRYKARWLTLNGRTPLRSKGAICISWK